MIDVTMRDLEDLIGGPFAPPAGRAQRALYCLWVFSLISGGGGLFRFRSGSAQSDIGSIAQGLACLAPVNAVDNHPRFHSRRLDTQQ
jgi:hypothetical protein